ncbi:MAG: TonB-dependent receptor [Acidobacteria bacterium]|nr:TonB-dependent receptor [Acidobacteriota bacterium]
MVFLSTAALAAGVRGDVKDRSGAAVSGAEVLVLTPQRAVIATTRTGATGAFTLPTVQPGRYLIIVRAPGFQEHQAVLDVTARDVTTAAVLLDVAPLEEHVTVTASPGEVLDAQRAAQPVNIISADEIARRATTVLAEAVNEEVGVSLQRTSSTMAGVFIRGLTGNKVNVFVDGVRYSNSAQRGGVNTFFDLVEPSGLEGIEVLRGPNSAEYGSDALGGSVQLLARVPALSPDGTTRVNGAFGLHGASGHESLGGNVSMSIGRPTFGVYANLAGRRAGTLRPGGGIDSHAAVARFLGLRSDALSPERLPDTEFHQWGGVLKANWTPNPTTQLVSSYMATRQDGAKRYDQLLGGDGNLIAELNDLTLDLFYVRLERQMTGPFDHASLAYSFNSQREERVNQGGNGNPRATIGQEPERTTANGISGSVLRQLSPRLRAQIGGELYLERLTSEAFNVNPVTGAVSPRRPRVPSGATSRNGGIFAQTTVDAVPERLKLVGTLRWGGVRYEASAADAPVVGGMPLWPDDDLSTSAVTFRAGAILSPTDAWSFSTSVIRGYRAPHMSDLGTLGLTGSGFEVAFPDVTGRGATVGSTADSSAVSTGNPVEQVRAESSLAWDATLRYRERRTRAEFSVFVNNVHDNIQKQALILPAGAAGTRLGTEVITQQTPNGVVFVAAATTPVLVRDNFDNARIWGIEATGEVTLAESLALNVLYTYTRARDTATGLPPNIEGGTPAPNAHIMLRYAKPGGRWWVQPYIRVAAEQPNLSTLDLGDRRTGAERSRTSIRNFFLNGATARGWVAPGPDGTLGTADDVLSATGETVAQIQNRVLGAATSAPLFRVVEGYTTIGVRGGIRIGRHEVLIDAENLTDRNYRGISWGMDAPGIGVNCRYLLRF